MGGIAASSGATTPSACKPDPLANFRDIIYSQDGWGGNQVNQDTHWDVPASPEPANKEIPLWKQTASNGTEVWEVNLRNGGQAPPPISQPKAPWGHHTPSNNLGGTWGEDDESTEPSSMWTGAPSSNGSAQWGGGSGSAGVGASGGGNSGMSAGPMTNVIGTTPAPAAPGMAPGMASGNGMWGGPKKEEWTGQNMGPGPTGWGDVRSSRMTMTGLGPPGPEAMPMGPGGQSHWPGPQSKTGQWTGGPPKEMKPSGWDEPSPPAQKRPVPNFDDGTSVWGTPQMQSGSVSRWKDMPNVNVAGRGGMQQAGPPPARMPPGPAMKTDMPTWAQTRNGSWADGNPDNSGNMMWMEDKSAVGGAPWNEPPQTPTPWGPTGPKPKTPTTPSWVESDDGAASWGQPPKQVQKSLTKEMIWSSKQFRILSDMGFKKDDVENVLRACNMVMEDALEMLRSGRMGMDSSWHRSADEHGNSYDPMGGHHATPYPTGQRFNTSQQLPFVHTGGSQGAHHLLSNPTSALGLNSNPAFKLLQQQQPPPIPPQVNICECSLSY